MNNLIYSDELYHHGVKGMKWGVRRYQNKDGSFASAEKKQNRENDSHKFFGSNKKRMDQGEVKAPSAKESKSHKDMTDAELKKATDRYNLEANYLSARSRATPNTGRSEKESFAKKIVNEAVKPALINAGRQQLEKYMNKEVSKLLGADNKDSIEALRQRAERLGLESKISSSKKVLETNRQWFEEQKAREDARASAQKQVADYNRQERKRYEGAYRKKGEDIYDNQHRDDSNFHPLSVSNKSTAVAKTVSKDKRIDYEILDGQGNVIARFNKNRKRKRW